MIPTVSQILGPLGSHVVLDNDRDIATAVVAVVQRVRAEMFKLARLWGDGQSSLFAVNTRFKVGLQGDDLQRLIPEADDFLEGTVRVFHRMPGFRASDELRDVIDALANEFLPACNAAHESMERAQTLPRHERTAAMREGVRKSFSCLDEHVARIQAFAQKPSA